ncbi:hypothetical protein GUITHDRAFT_139516 [Guillardia theta CCMP2712]|uniref:Uncharacterized protein n=1 Tax=Guillardia theta (strain CCMP2712) TaxID=905079 RepID=L1J8T0_GUITC|nr:hypothetical protein GUITHDRAFT_139516 [Guillardia theta CCMP2712]EKX44926.1 hypothetical protein GUITHDRAFT_139516 [Guillardia theta CCMP2712]|eukprot:XP_005831906.1 hypothetical protein GUITHDRAFT_139516 [Guillardia theta CCMP2712]
MVNSKAQMDNILKDQEVKVLDADSSSFYAHHWIQPHSTPFVHEQGWFRDHKAPSYSTFSTARTSSLQYSPDSWWTKLHYGGAKFRIEEHDKTCIPGSVWVAGESV